MAYLGGQLSIYIFVLAVRVGAIVLYVSKSLVIPIYNRTNSVRMFF